MCDLCNKNHMMSYEFFIKFLMEHCFDKQKVRNAIRNPKNFMNSDIGRIPDLEAIEKELGLNE